MEANPYAAPTAVLETAIPYTSSELEARKATRLRRLAAAVVDVFIAVVGWALIYGGMSRPIVVSLVSNRPLSMPPFFVFGLCGTAVLLGLVIGNCVLLHRSGQTIGKRTLNIVILRTDGGRVGLTRVLLLRALPISVIMLIPWLGKVAWLADVLLIFGNDRRCLHDLLADTIVVDV